MSAERIFAVFLVFVAAVIGALAAHFGTVLIGTVCAVVAAGLAVALWTPLRDWLGIGQAEVTQPAGRVGVYAGPGSRTNVREGAFGPKLDLGIHNDGGDVDAEKADFQ